MTPDLPGPPTNEPPTPAGDFDFAALVAEQNEANATQKADNRRSRGANNDAAAATASGSEKSFVSESLRSSAQIAPTVNPKSHWWRFGYPAVIGAVVLIFVPVLVFLGLRVILDSSDGQLVKRVTNPAAPGYEAVVEKTPTAVAAIIAPDGSLDSAVVFALTSETSSGLLFVPGSIGVSTMYGMLPLSAFWLNEQIDGVANGLGQVLNLNFSESFVIPIADWSVLVGPYSPLTVSTPDAVRDARDVVVFPKGTTTLTAAQVGSFITSKAPSDNDANRLLRQELFWKAWLAKISSSTAVFPGSTISGLGRFLASAARGQLSISSLPVVPVPTGSPLPGGGPMYTTQESAALNAVAAIVPFPDGAPGRRPRLRVLDGTGQLSNGINAAIILNAAGGQVDVVGNAKSFGQATTQIIYFEGTTEASAKKMRDALTVGEIVESKQSNSGADMTVILGEDFLEKFGPTSGVVPSSSSSSTSAPE
ncbi:MAG: LytR C-terminal domain-containing protein [Acidimicrobiales bacterium]